MLKIEDYANHMVHPDSAIILVDSIFANDHPSEKTVGLLQLFKAKAMFRKYYYTIDFPTGVDSIIASSWRYLKSMATRCVSPRLMLIKDLFWVLTMIGRQKRCSV
ncbi:hypothetical protein [Hoylesella oralis]|uniref:hypothetical protein n=1 Tax=Hoylesella oralis TaxID=28134 RepID=UPI0003A46B3B|nr:hypothetical protein [Hoylesella oralis]